MRKRDAQVNHWGLVCMADHIIKAWSNTQTVIALSTGEAELYALNKTVIKQRANFYPKNNNNKNNKNAI